MGLWQGVAPDFLKYHSGPPYYHPSTPCRRANPETALRPFQEWPTGRAAFGRLLPPWTPHAVRLCFSLSLSPVLKSTIPLRQAYSVGSTCSAWNLAMRSCNVRISASTAIVFSCDTESADRPGMGQRLLRWRRGLKTDFVSPYTRET
jgi:hypothetical protein